MYDMKEDTYMLQKDGAHLKINIKKNRLRNVNNTSVSTLTVGTRDFSKKMTTPHGYHVYLGCPGSIGQ